MREKLTRFVSDSSLRAYLLSSLSALFLTLSFPKFNISIFVFFSLTLLFYAVKECKEDLLKTIKVGIVFGILHFSTLLYWIVYTLDKYGNIPWFFGIFLLLLLSLYFSIYPVLFLILSAKIRAFTEPAFLKALFVSLFFVSTEYLRSTLLSGFPWGLIGYPLANFPLLIQFADLFGIWGLSFLVVFVNYYFFHLLVTFQRFSIKIKSFVIDQLLYLFLLLVLIGYNLYSFSFWKDLLSKKTEGKEDLYKVTLLQGNIPQELKEAKEIEISQKVYERLLKASLLEKPKFIFYPETALPFYFPHDSDHTLKFLSLLKEVEEVAEWGPAIVFGTFRVSTFFPAPRIHNSLLVWRQGEIVDLYDKEKLVPFGEYIPLGEYFPFLRRVSVVSDILRPGQSKNLRVTFEEGEITFVPLICFESAFSQILVKRLRKGGDFVFIATNDAWFGKTSAPYQHFQMAVVRAVEGRKYVLQSANTGISGIVDALGRILTKSNLEKEELLSGEIILLREKTFYVRRGYLFPLFSLILTVGVLAWIIFLKHRGRLSI